MTIEAARNLGEAERASLIAPAGYGKTWTIARAVAYAPTPQLVLTHTHAGVHAIRHELAAAGVPTTDFHVDTIAGFATRWAASYPETAGWDSAPDDPDWDSLYEATRRVLARPQLLASVERSYEGVLVDEYQDCDLQQHELVLDLAELLPTRIVGDPLQGIYTFGASPSVDFKADVYPHFPQLDPLTTPWRWIDNEPLAEDLARLREELLAGDTAIDLSEFPAIHIEGGYGAAVNVVCDRLIDLGGRAVVIRNSPQQAHSTASRLSGRFVSMEEVEGRDIVAAAERIQDAHGHQRPAALLDVLQGCTTTVVPALSSQRGHYEDGSMARARSERKLPVVEALNQLAAAHADDLSALPIAIERVCNFPNAVVYRPEIPEDLSEAARRHTRHDSGRSLASQVRQLRDERRRYGRRLPNRVVSRTLLVKGLQFDHAAVLDLNSMNDRNCYVALTRASTTVTVIS